MRTIIAAPLTREAFAPYGDVIELAGAPSFQINRGRCDRYHDLARLAFLGDGGRPNISLARAKPYPLPLTLDLMERHPLGSQAFVPLGPDPFLVVVAPDVAGQPGTPLAFLTAPGQGINYLANTWHAVLTPLARDADFLIVDRTGPGENLQEHILETPYRIAAPP